MKKIFSLAEVIEWKYGPVAGTIQVDIKDKKPNPKMKISSWHHPDIKKPSTAQLEKDFAEYEVYLKSKEYKELRSVEYPSIEDQLDALWKGGIDAEVMKSRIEDIKKKHPKG